MVVVAMGSAEVEGVGVARKARLVFLRAATAPSRTSRLVLVLVQWCVCVEVVVDSSHADDGPAH